MNAGSTAIITLYRGDSSKIHEFQISKTNKYCLVGKGIYLTDTLKLANSYRTKGAPYASKGIILAQGTFPSKGEAMDRAFDAYLSHYFAEQHGSEFSKASTPVREAFRKEMLWRWEEDLAHGTVTVTGSRTFETGYYYKSKVQYATEIRLKQSNKVIGRVSVFEFDNTDNRFDNSVVNLSSTIRNPKVLEAMAKFPYFNPLKIETKEYIENFGVITEAQNIKVNPVLQSRILANPSDRIRRYRNPLVCKYEPTDKQSAIIQKAIQKSGGYNGALNRLSRVLKSAGFQGYEYDGGVLIGGYGRHRAFALWDQGYVNDHFIERTI